MTYVWYDALINYATAAGYPSDRARFDRYWPTVHHFVGKDILRFHAVYWPAMLMAAGELPPKQVFAHGWLLVGGEKMSKTRANQIFPADLVRDFGVDGFRYFFMADQRFGPDGDLSYEAMVARYNADLANNFGNLANRVLTMAVNYLGGTSPDHREDGPLRDEAARAYATQAEAFGRFDFAGGLEAVWGLVRATNAVHRGPGAVGAEQGGRHRRGGGRPRRLPRGSADRGAAGVAGDPDRGGRAVAAPRAGRPSGGSAPARRGGVGRDARWGGPREGRAPVPPLRGRARVTPAATGGWFDSHCHVQPPYGPEGVDAVDELLVRARTAGVHRFVCVGTDLASSRLAVALAHEHDDVWATVGLHPHDAARLPDEQAALRELAASSARVVAVGEAGFDLYYRHAEPSEQEDAFRRQIRWAGELDRTLVIHTRDAWDDTFRVLAEEGVPTRTVFHCFTGGPAEAARALELGAWLSFSGIVSFKNAEDAPGGCPRDAAGPHAGRDRLALPGARPPPRAHQRTRLRDRRR